MTIPDTIEATPTGVGSTSRGLTHSLDLGKEGVMPDPICIIDGCDRPVLIKSRGWCRRHYLRWQRHGDPLSGGLQRGVLTPSERFWRRVEFTGFCWLFPSGRKDGYAYFGIDASDGRMAHSFAWENLIGPIPPGLELDHLCRIRNCVNPDHLEPVTPRMNVRRALAYRRDLGAKSHCKRGHALTEGNRARNGTRPDGGPAWTCLECRRRRDRLRFRGRD